MTLSCRILLVLVPLFAAAAESAVPPAAVVRPPEAALVGDVRLLVAAAPGLGSIHDVAVDEDGRGGVLITPEIVLRHQVLGRLGYLVGVGLFASAHSLTDDTTDGTFVYYAGGAQASAGLTFRIKPGWHAELRALGQIGRGALVFTPEDDDDDDRRGAVGRYRAVGGLGGVAYTMPGGLELAGHVGWQDVEGRSQFAGQDTIAEGRGLMTGVSLGFVF